MTSVARVPARSPRVSAALWRLGVAVTLIAAWELTARRTTTLLLPPASDTLGAMARLVMSRDFWRALGRSHEALLVGFAVAAVVGVPLGLALGHWPRLGRWIRPHLQILLIVPISAIIPLVIMFAGLSLTARSFVVFTFAFPIIAVTAEAGMASVSPRLVEMARAFGATRSQEVQRILLPAAWPAIVTALRLGFARAFSGMVVGELVLMATGVGSLILRFQADFDAASIFACVVLIVIEAVVLMRATVAAERQVLGWYTGPSAS